MRSYARRRSPVVLMLGVLMAISGCERGPDKVDYLRKANALCARYDAEIRRVGEPSGPMSHRVAQARRVSELSREESRRLRRTPAPIGDRSELKRIFDLADRGLSEGEKSIGDIERGDTAGAKDAAANADRLIGEANRRLAAYGLTECAK